MLTKHMWLHTNVQSIAPAGFAQCIQGVRDVEARRQNQGLWPRHMGLLQATHHRTIGKLQTLLGDAHDTRDGVGLLTWN